MNPALSGALARGEIRRGDVFAVAPMPTFSSGFAALDAELPGGGWPRGSLTELLAGSPGIGELGLLLPALGALTEAGGRVLLVAPPHAAHAPAWAAAGVCLESLHRVFPRRPRDALWAAVESLRCGGVAATLLWLERDACAALPANSLRRLQVAAGEGGGAAFCFRPASLAAHSSPAPLRLALHAAGRQLRVHLLKRRGPPARQDLMLDLARPAALPESPAHVAGHLLPTAADGRLRRRRALA